MNSFSRYSEKQPVTNDLYYESYDDDCLVDYDESDLSNEKQRRIKPNNIRFQLSSLSKQVKKGLSTKKLNNNNNNSFELDYLIEYTHDGHIKRPAYSLQGGYEIDVAISMDIITSILLVQHCKISKEQATWYSEALLWLVKKEGDSVVGLERACESYFGIPLGRCEHHWASEYLIARCRKRKVFHRNLIRPNKVGNSVGGLIRKLCCCFPFTVSKNKRYGSDYGAVDYNEKIFPLSL